jgi:hypothetical protein
MIDCRCFPAFIPCEFAASGDEEDVLDIAVQHAVEYPGFRDTPALREQLRSMLREESVNSGNFFGVAEHLLSYRTNTGRFSASSAACLLGCFFKG